MSIVYLDYNVVASIAGIPPQADAATERAAMMALQGAGVRFALSAWTAYELSRSLDTEHVRKCCDFVEKLAPLWVSDFRYLIDREIARFLTSRPNPGTALTTPPVRALNETIGRMWSTFGLSMSNEVTFRHFVAALRTDPKSIELVVEAAETAARAVTAARSAHADGRAQTLQPLIDRSIFAQRLSVSVRRSRLPRHAC